MFIGEYSHTIDDKGRIAVPRKFRDRLSQGAVVTKGLDGCLAIYTRGEWDKISVQVSELPISRGAARSFQRHLFAGAMEVEMDGQGRVVLPVGLRSHAHLEGTAVQPVSRIGSRSGTPSFGNGIPPRRIRRYLISWTNSAFKAW